MTTKTSLPPILLSIDLQKGMVTGSPEFGPRSTPDLEKNITTLFSHWRANSWPIIHIQHDDVDNPENPISARFPETYAIHPIAQPVAGEKVFVKHTGSAFIATGLGDELDRINLEGHGQSDGDARDRKVVIVGMDGAECVNSTTRNGADLGYMIVVVGDACATYSTREWDGSGKGWNDRVNVGAEVTHRIAMGMLEGYAKVVTTEGLLKQLQEP